MKDGDVMWHELMATNKDKAKQFYGALFGWSAEDDQSGVAPYTLFKQDGEMKGGMFQIDPETMAGAQPIWMTYFTVADVDAAIKKVTELGGTVHREPFEIPNVGRTAVVADCCGAVFYLITPAQQGGA